MASFMQKLTISMGSAGVFALVNLPQTYQFTNNTLDLGTYDTATNCPTNVGLIIHAIVFFVLTYLSMGNPIKNIGMKLRHTLFGALIFYLLSSPAVYATITLVAEGQFVNANGCPNIMGVLLHALVYCATVMVVMYLPTGNK